MFYIFSLNYSYVSRKLRVQSLQYMIYCLLLHTQCSYLDQCISISSYLVIITVQGYIARSMNQNRPDMRQFVKPSIYSRNIEMLDILM